MTSDVSIDFVEACVNKFKTLLDNKKYQVLKNNDTREKSLYNMGKENQTKTRNLKKALEYYSEAAAKGQKINSCIKDFASILHQCGFTNQAILFLRDMKEVYKGDKQKYEKLIQNLKGQLKPTGKHLYKYLLIDLVDIKPSQFQYDVFQMFQNGNRIRSIKNYEDVGFCQISDCGKYIVLQFDSFSAAKKTLETFKFDEWFGVDIFWMDSAFNIVCSAFDAKTDFSNGLQFQKGMLYKIQGQTVNQHNMQWTVPNFAQLFGYAGLRLQNQQSIYLIKYYSRQVRQLKND